MFVLPHGRLLIGGCNSTRRWWSLQNLQFADGCIAVTIRYRNQIVVDIVVGCKKQGEKRGRPLGKRFFDATNEGERRPVLLVYMTVVRVYERYLKPRQVDCAQGEPRGSWSPYDWMRARFLRRT